ncbi:hypothetical protein [Streptosporangium sp. NPDC001681]|uniref:hypothetical protein n=1 Tax=Streptosporangium sp. NPDC001681 TaxID=3154395 RepID=UPI003317F21B
MKRRIPRVEGTFTQHLEKVTGTKKPFIPMQVKVPTWSRKTGDVGMGQVVSPFTTHD